MTVGPTPLSLGAPPASGEQPDRFANQHERSDDPLVEAIRCAHLPMLISDARAPHNPIIFVNDAFLKLTGYAREEILGHSCAFLQGPETDPTTVRQISLRLAAGQDVSVEILNYRKDGSCFWNGLHISPVRMAGGEVRHFFASQSDVSEKKAQELQLRDSAASLERSVESRTEALLVALEQKTVLLHEVDHRVKNNLQLISALMLLQARRAGDPTVKAALQRMLERLNAISTVHRRLFQSDDAASFDLAEFMRDLAADLSGSISRDEIAVELTLEPVSVPANQAAPIALLLNEILTNSLHHAFPEDRGGTVVLSLRRDDTGYHIHISDDGVGRGEHKPGFGSTIIDLLGRQLKATLNYSDAAPGAAVHIRIPDSPARAVNA